MQRLYPDQQNDPDDDALAASYAYPAAAVPGGGSASRVRANMVGSLDGRGALSGVSGALSSPADQHLLDLLRDLADVVLVGAGTIRAEGYTGLSLTDRRARWGFAGAPPLAVVTRGNLDPGLPIFTTTSTPPLVITTRDAGAALLHLPATVITAGDSAVDLADALDQLAARGLPRVLCEGGPSLLARLVEADRLDELCLTTAPIVAGPATALFGDPAVGLARRWRLRSLHLDGDHVFSHYVREAE